jgi:hypothetical protein
MSAQPINLFQSFSYFSHVPQENTPVGIPTDFAEGFKDLQSNISDYQSRFNKYVSDQGQTLSQQVQVIQTQINDALLSLAAYVPT